MGSAGVPPVKPALPGGADPLPSAPRTPNLGVGVSDTPHTHRLLDGESRQTGNPPPTLPAGYPMSPSHRRRRRGWSGRNRLSLRFPAFSLPGAISVIKRKRRAKSPAGISPGRRRMAGARLAAVAPGSRRPPPAPAGFPRLPAALALIRSSRFHSFPFQPKQKREENIILMKPTPTSRRRRVAAMAAVPVAAPRPLVMCRNLFFEGDESPAAI